MSDRLYKTDGTHNEIHKKQNVFNYLGEIPWENTVIVLRDPNFHICPMARCKDNKYFQLQDKNTHRNCVCSKWNAPDLLTVRAATCIAGARPPAMSLCGSSKITFQATWLQPNNACLVAHSHTFLLKKQKTK